MMGPGGLVPARGWEPPPLGTYVYSAEYLALCVAERFGAGGQSPSAWFDGLSEAEQSLLLAFERLRRDEERRVAMAGRKGL